MYNVIYPFEDFAEQASKDSTMIFVIKFFFCNMKSQPFIHVLSEFGHLPTLIGEDIAV